MPVLQTKTTFLEMLQPPAGNLAPPRADVRIDRVAGPGNDYYRGLYRSVGAKLCWVDRLVMPDDQLRAILQDDRVDLFVLTVAGQPAGYAELDRRRGSEIELAYFGLFPAFIGQGLGKFFLNWTLHAAWALGPTRVWVHTCDLDHPAALPTYQKAGLRIYDEKIVSQFLPDSYDRVAALVQSSCSRRDPNLRNP